jgi:hypothetical protein
MIVINDHDDDYRAAFCLFTVNRNIGFGGFGNELI